MMKQVKKYTPGPWLLEFNDDGAICYEANGAIIASVPRGLQAWRHNAYLLRKAPGLLEALEKLLAIGDAGVLERREEGKPVWHVLDEVKRIAGSAIAEASGDDGMEGPNRNCLEGMRCPDCGSYGPFEICCECTATVSDDGTDDAHDFGWGDEDYCKCLACNSIGTVKNFSAKPV